MADLITRLKVDSTEYDAKIKRAAQGLQHYVQSAHDSGDVIGRLLGNTKKYVESLGNMATVSTTARGRLNELTAAFTDLRSVYNSLSEEEKSAKGGFGQELNKQLEILKGRINDTKNELKGIDQELGNTKQAEDGAKGGLEGLTSALGINVKSLMGWGTALAAGKVALDVAKDAFMANESSVDEWGRTVESAKGIYEGFLQALNTGDFSGFLGNISQITAAAREAYNALDELGTRQTILNPERAKLQARSTELKATIRREGADSSAGKAAAKELKALEKPLTDAWKTESKLNRNAFESLVKQRLKEGGINLNQKSFSQFMKTFSDDKAFQQLRRGASGSVTTGTYGNAGITATKTIDTRNTNQKLLDLFTDEWRKKNSGYLTAAYNAEGSAASTMLSDARYLKGGKGGGAGGGKKNTKQEIQFADDSIMAQEKLVQELTQKWKTASGELRDGYLKDLTAAQNKLNEMTGKGAKAPEMTTGLSGFNEQTISAWTSMIKDQLSKENIGSDMYNSLTQNLADMSTLTTAVQDAMKLGLQIPQEAVQEMFEAVFDQGNLPEDLYAGMIQKFIDDFKERTGQDLEVGENGALTVGKGKGKEEEKKDEKQNKSVAEGFGQLTGGIQQMVGSMQQLGIEIPAGLSNVLGGIQSVVTILTTISTIVSAIEAISAADTFIPFARGGIVRAAGGFSVPGNNYSGDRVPALLNSGELVLNKAQQGNLASQLEDGAAAAENTQPFINGEMIYLGLQAYMRRSGLGEIVTSER